MVSFEPLLNDDWWRSWWRWRLQISNSDILSLGDSIGRPSHIDRIAVLVDSVAHRHRALRSRLMGDLSGYSGHIRDLSGVARSRVDVLWACLGEHLLRQRRVRLELVRRQIRYACSLRGPLNYIHQSFMRKIKLIIL